MLGARDGGILHPRRWQSRVLQHSESKAGHARTARRTNALALLWLLHVLPRPGSVALARPLQRRCPVGPVEAVQVEAVDAEAAGAVAVIAD